MVALRTTPQKMKIMEFLDRSRDHPTAEVVYQEVLKELPNISLATVYRNLNFLVLQGKIMKYEINGEFHFDGVTDKHQHLICIHCGKIMDVEQKEIHTYAMKKINYEGFDPDYVNITYYGSCKDCKK